MKESNAKILKMEGLSNLKVLKISIRCGQEIRQSNNLVPSFENSNLCSSRNDTQLPFHRSGTQICDVELKVQNLIWKLFSFRFSVCSPGLWLGHPDTRTQTFHFERVLAVFL